MTSAPTFNLSVEERSVLGRGLHVLALGPDRMEIAVKERIPTFMVFMSLIPVILLLFLLLFSFLVSAFDSEHPEIYANHLATFPLFLLCLLLNRIVASKCDTGGFRAVRLFAGTAWAVARRNRLPSYERVKQIEPLPAVSGNLTPWEDRIILHTSTRKLVLKKRWYSDVRTVNDCRAILTRLVKECSEKEAMSAAFEAQSTMDAFPTELPHEQYAAVVDQGWLLALSPAEMSMMSRMTMEAKAALMGIAWALDGLLILIGFFVFDPKRPDFGITVTRRRERRRPLPTGRGADLGHAPHFKRGGPEIA
jgi:hypothetical protein